MPYYVKTKERESGPYTGATVKAMFGRGEVTLDTYVSKVAGEEWTKQLRDYPEILSDAPVAKTSFVSKVFSAKEHLAAVRERSCYGVYRKVLAGAFILLELSLIGYVSTTIYFAWNATSKLLIAAPFLTFVSIILLIVGSVLFYAAYQASLLLVDIADTVIDFTRK